MTQPPQAHLPRPVHHEPPAHAPNAALMIDFDNVTMGIRSDLQSELRRLLQSDIIKGKVAVQRAYADWRRYPQYIVPLAESSIDMIWAPAYGSNKKNATDIRLAVDALELVFTRPEIGTFILLSGDSDFSSLVLKLKEYGKYVIGVGIRESSSDLLIQNCDEYYSYNELAGLTKESDVTHERHDPWELVIEAVKQMTAHSDVMRSDRLKQVMQEIDPAFNEKDLPPFRRPGRAPQRLLSRRRVRPDQTGHRPVGRRVPPGERPGARRSHGRDQGRRGAGRAGPGAKAAAPGARPGADRPRQGGGRSLHREATGRDVVSRSTAGRACRRDRCRRGARSAHARVLGATIDAAGQPARCRHPVPQRPVPQGFAWATRGAPGDFEDRRRRDGPELQASDRVVAAQAASRGTGAVRQRQRSRGRAAGRRRATRARWSRARRTRPPWWEWRHGRRR